MTKSLGHNVCVWIFISVVQGELSTINRKQIYYLGILNVTTVYLQVLNVFFFLCLFLLTVIL